MIKNNITMQECVELNVYWENKHSTFFMKAWGKDGLSPDEEVLWKEATDNKDRYWLYGINKWKREYSYAHYYEKEKQNDKR